MGRQERRVIEREMWILKGLIYSWQGSWKRKITVDSLACRDLKSMYA